MHFTSAGRSEPIRAVDGSASRSRAAKPSRSWAKRIRKTTAGNASAPARFDKWSGILRGVDVTDLDEQQFPANAATDPDVFQEPYVALNPRCAYRISSLRSRLLDQ